VNLRVPPFIVAVEFVLSTCIAADVDNRSPLATLPPLKISLDSSHVVVVSPGGSEYRTIARTVAEGLSKPPTAIGPSETLHWLSSS
jgi:hypothetical protein